MSNTLFARFAGEPALVAEHLHERLAASLVSVAEHPRFAEMSSDHGNPDEDFWSGDWGEFRPYIVRDGVLQIPVKGVLLHDFPYALGSWATGYDYIWKAFQRGCADYSIGAIKGIALVLDTPGGMVAGCFDAVDKMVALKEATGVPVRAFAHEAAYSAGYAVATVADYIVVSRTGGVGSIGVITSHMDYSGYMDKIGIKVTLIASDPSKSDGYPTKPLSTEAEARIQARIDELYTIFLAAVVRSRGIDESVLRKDLKAHCFTATQALSNGLADSIGSLEDTMVAFAADLSETEGDERMSTKDTAAETQAAIDQAVAAALAEQQNTMAAAVAAATVAATARVTTIIGCEEAKNFPDLAAHLASNTTMTVDEAKATLVAAAKTPVKEQDHASAFDAAMGDGPGVGAAAGKSDNQPVEDGSDIRSLAASVGLKGFARVAK